MDFLVLKDIEYPFGHRSVKFQFMTFQAILINCEIHLNYRTMKNAWEGFANQCEQEAEMRK